MKRMQELQKSGQTIQKSPDSILMMRQERTPRTTQSPSIDESLILQRRSGRPDSDILKEVLRNQKDILAQLALMRKDISDLKLQLEKRNEDTKQPISVPNRIRNSVKEFFSSGEDRELSWDYQRRFYDDINKEMTDFIKKSVKGVNPDVSSEVLDEAIKRYFTSKKEAANRKAKNKDISHKQRQASYERKKEKVRRRLLACDKKASWGQNKRMCIKGILTSKSSYNLMSSDEEGDEGFVSHPYSWESESWRQIKDSLDKKYISICPPRSKRLLQKRVKGATKQQEPPKVAAESAWIIDLE